MASFIETFINGQSVTTLNGSINNSVTSIIVTDATQLPALPNYRIRIDNELLLVTAISSNILTVLRGIEGTSAASHTSLSFVNFELTQDAMRSDVVNGIINVKSLIYGAKGDGATDDYPAIQAALTAANGASVYLPPGTYLLSSGQLILANNGTKLFGHNAIIKRNSNSFNGFLISANFCVIEDIEIDGNSKTNSGIEITGTNNKILRVNCHNNGTHGVVIEGVGSIGNQGRFNIIRDCDVYSNGQVGIAMHDGQDNSILHNYCAFNGFEGITSDISSFRNTIHGNRCMSNCQSGGAAGISIDNSDITIISSNQVHATSGQPGIITNNNIGTSSYCTIMNNICFDNGGPGIYLKNGSGGASLYNTLVGNVLRGNTTAPIKIDSGCNNNIVIGNSMNGDSITNSGSGNVLANNL